jgi:hypothetical protein
MSLRLFRNLKSAQRIEGGYASKGGVKIYTKDLWRSVAIGGLIYRSPSYLVHRTLNLTKSFNIRKLNQMYHHVCDDV